MHGKFLLITLSLPAVFFIAGCTETEPTASALAPSPESETKTLTLYSWDDYFTPEALKGFEELTGAKVVYKTYPDGDEMVENVRSSPGEFDVVVTDGPFIQMMKDVRLLRDLDHGKLSNFAKNVDPKFVDLPFDQKNRFTVPYMWGTTLLAYRNDKIEDPEKSWSMLFDPRYSGKVSMLKARNDSVPTALLALGLDPNSVNRADYERAEAKMLDLVVKNKARMGDDQEMKDHLLSGESWVAMMYSGDAAFIADPSTNKSENISFFIPEEGAVMWMDNFAILQASQNVDLAHQFLNYMMEAKVAASVSNYLWYATTNKAAEPFLDAELVADVTINPPKEVKDKCQFLGTDPVVQRLMNLAWKNVDSAFGAGVSDVAGSK